MATRFVLTPHAAEYPSTNYPQELLVNRRPALAFDAATAETCYWTGVIPQGWTGTITLVIKWIAASATTGLADFEVAVEAITPADALDMDAADGFDTVNTQAGVTVPGTAGYEGETTVTLTNHDSSAAGDYVRFALTRDATDGTNDTAAGDVYVLLAEVRDGA